MNEALTWRLRRNCFAIAPYRHLRDEVFHGVGREHAEPHEDADPKRVLKVRRLSARPTARMVFHLPHPRTEDLFRKFLVNIRAD